MFKLIKDVSGVRTGTFSINGKNVKTPCFFATSDFGGGGTNVSRLFAYSDLLLNTNIQLLVNYYYLDIHSDLKHRFDTRLIRDFETISNVIDFIQHVKKDYIPSKVISNFKLSTKKWEPLVLLDSGSGNILRNLIVDEKINLKEFKSEYEKVVERYYSFVEKHKVDIAIAMDFAGKNTNKDGEHEDENYTDNINLFKNKNMDLLDINLKAMKKNKDIELYIPLHGKNLKEYLDFLKKVILLEKSENNKFTGFAIGGIGNPIKADRSVWGIPENANGRVKAAMFLYKLTNGIRTEMNKNKDFRPIHVLGAASPYNIIPLIIAGADSFDCHSTWRRASDGNSMSKETVKSSIASYPKDIPEKSRFSKVLVPLLNNREDIILKNKDNYLEFVELYKLNNDNFECNCHICSKYNLTAIKELYSGNNEENYFAKILIYLHSVNQYAAISDSFSNFNKKEDIIKFINNIPDCDYKKDMIEFLKEIKF